jgi:circadian clock protein KaiB
MQHSTEKGATAHAGVGGTVVLRLFVASEAPNSQCALAIIESICQTELDCHIEVIDALDEPARALEDGVLVIPTLLKLAPEPMRRFTGNLGDAEQLLSALELGGEHDE